MKLPNLKIIYIYLFSVSVTITYNYPKMTYLLETLYLGFREYFVSIWAHVKIYFMYSGFGNNMQLYSYSKKGTKNNGVLHCTSQYNSVASNDLLLNV